MAKALSQLVNLDQAEADAKKRFEEKKAEGAACEARIKKEQEVLASVTQELVRIQGEYRAIQNLRKKAGGGEKLPAKRR